MAKRRGRVFLVGAGPGDAGLITVRGVECLAMADVVIYDHLANEALLAHARAGAELIYAGKQPHQHSMTQEETNAALLAHAREGRTVVRLKGGDPFVFGRGGEEAILLAEHGIAFEVVPGVTSAVAVPAYAGIPITHRDVNLSFHVVAGHDKEVEDAPDIDWETLARSDGTIVFLMGVRNVREIVKRLTEHGRSPDTPAAMVRWGTMPEQETIVTTLGELPAEVARHNFLPPAVTIVGPVVALRGVIKWAEKRPLFGVRAAITRPLDQSGALADLLRGAGADVLVMPTISTQPRAMNPDLRRELTSLQKYDWVAFTSANAVTVFFSLLEKAGLDARALRSAYIGAVGDRTADMLRRHGLKADAVPKGFVQEKLAAAMGVEAGQKVLVPCASVTRENLERELRARGAEVRVLPIYDTAGDRNGITRLRQALTQGRLSLVTFTSTSTFERFAETVKDEDLPRLFADVHIASIGPVTSAAIRDAGLPVTIEASRHTAEGLAEEIVSHFRKHRPPRPDDTKY